MLDHLTRRHLLRAASLAAFSACLPPLLRSADVLRTVSTSKILILLELEGGNDGLNTIVPFSDPAYALARSTLELTRSAAPTSSDEFEYTKTYIQLANDGDGKYNFTDGATGLAGSLTGLGIHKALAALGPAWQAKDLAVVQGVGYANPNRSHFRGIDIWNNAATDSQAFVSSGWLGRMFTSEGVDTVSKTNGMLFRRPNNNPLVKADLRAVSLSTPEEFIKNSEEIAAFAAAAPVVTGNPALDQVLTARFQAAQARDKLVAATGPAEAAIEANWGVTFPDTTLGKQAKHIARCIAGGLSCPFYKMSLGGFDNHTDQKTKHADLLGDVGKSLAALRLALTYAGKWNDVLVMTYAEFGRRVKQNDSSGTDHGTAAPHFFMGGSVNGGIYGSHPSLTTLDSSGDMLFGTDFRQLYATCGAWLGVNPTNVNSALTLDSGTTFAPLAVV